MRRVPFYLNIRVRLLVVYVGILAIGFMALALVAGEQIATAARVDYERSLQTTVQLIAQGISPALANEADSETLTTLIAGYESQTGGTIRLHLPEDPSMMRASFAVRVTPAISLFGTPVGRIPSTDVSTLVPALTSTEAVVNPPSWQLFVSPSSTLTTDTIDFTGPLLPSQTRSGGSSVIRTLPTDTAGRTTTFIGPAVGYQTQMTDNFIFMLNPDEMPRDLRTEIETAYRGDVMTVERLTEDGEPALFTAARIINGADHRLHGVVQLQVPLQNIQQVINQRWMSLWLVFGMITLVALASAYWLARSIIRPLDTLRETVVRLEKGDFTHRVAYDRPDEIGEVARAFNRMAAEVESMLNEQRAFASNTSHELRTPLTTIRLRSEALRYDPALDQDLQRQYITEIDDEVNRIGTLIEDLTLLSRFDAGRAVPGDNQIDPASFASSLCARLAPQTAEKHIQLTLLVPGGLPAICASINHLTVVFRNLLDNAVKYTPAGGQIEWQLTAGPDGLHSTITDTGRGLDEDELAHVFERFYRADKARSRDVPGSGLGLAIVRSIVEAYGGTVRLHSQGPGTGVTVTLFWPYRLQAERVLPQVIQPFPVPARAT